MPKMHNSIHFTPRAHFSDRTQWRDLGMVAPNIVPSFWRDWLFDTGSLTRRLLDASRGQLQVEVLSQKLQLPSLSERQALSLPANRLALVREVLLIGCGEPWVFARSILPLTTVTGRLRRLRHLDNRPLGALLFNDPTMTREPLQWACIEPGDEPLALPLAPLQVQAWGRRSVFKLSAKPLLVCEIYLPSFKPYGQPQHST